MAAVDFERVGLTYPGVGRQTVALDTVDLSVADGEPLAIIGPSGCGKSTLLLLAAGMLSPTTGSVRVGGQPVDGPRRTTALILQDFGLLPWKTVYHNAALGLEIRGVGRTERHEQTMRSLDLVGLTDFADAFPGELSGGMRQRLALARAIALDADLLLMDEPLSALDALTREDLQDLLLELWCRRGHAALLVTHSIAESVFLGRRIVVLSQRPGVVTAVVDNPGMGAPDYRMTEEFFAKVTEVRGLLVDEGALHSAATSGACGVRDGAARSPGGDA
ncbi:MAG: ABC transporter ATP-binding protein [Actinomycetota bacterium]|nr:ABC transporter ATP-binding protein [Actinomycetota bacterium]MDZ4180524.1 ABC transporter ATP-binding protein [Coriobacteriia bacterium]